MKNHLLTIGLVFFLAGCAAPPSEVPKTSEGSATPAPTQTPTLTATSTPTETPTPEPQTLLGTPENPAVCAVDDFYNGHWLELERANTEPFPEGTPVGSWHKILSSDAYTPYYFGPIEIASVCKLTGKIKDVVADGRVVIGYHIPDQDNPAGRFFHVMVKEIYLEKVLKRSHVGITNLRMPGLRENYEENGNDLEIALMDTNINNDVQQMLDELERGNFPKDLETQLLNGAWSR